jgi:hypothetical protein
MDALVLATTTLQFGKQVVLWVGGWVGGGGVPRLPQIRPRNSPVALPA